MDISSNNFNLQHQMNNGQLQKTIHYGIFSSELEKIYLFKPNQNSQILEMDMENGENHTGKTNGYSQYRNNNDESYKKTRRTNGSSNNNGNGSNPNRNNNNSRR